MRFGEMPRIRLKLNEAPTDEWERAAQREAAFPFPLGKFDEEPSPWDQIISERDTNNFPTQETITADYVLNGFIKGGR